MDNDGSGMIVAKSKRDADLELLKKRDEEADVVRQAKEDSKESSGED